MTVDKAMLERVREWASEAESVALSRLGFTTMEIGKDECGRMASHLRALLSLATPLVERDAGLVKRVARVLFPAAFDSSLDELHGPCFKGAGPWPGGEFYVWDGRHSSIFNPDGDPETGIGPYPWRKLATFEEAVQAADALNNRRFAWVETIRASARAQALALVTAILEGTKP